MKKPLILVGGGGHCKSVIEAAESAGYSILGVLDMREEVGKNILSTKVIGTDDDIPAYVDKAEFVITVGFIKNPNTRIKLYDKVKEAGGKLATVIASTAHVSKYATIGEGTVVMHQAFVNAGAMVGNNVILNTFTNIAVVMNKLNLCTIMLNELATFFRNAVRHNDYSFITTNRTNKCKAYSLVTACRFNDDGVFIDKAAAFGIKNHIKSSAGLY